MLRLCLKIKELIMKYKEKKKIIDQFLNKFQQIENVYDELSKTMGLNPESPLFKALYIFVDPMIEYVSKDIGDKDDWLSWYIWENHCGKKGLEASIGKDKKMKEITNVDELLSLIG
jgi:hypothetical protein